MTENETAKKLQQLEKEKANRKKKQKLNNRRIVYVKKETASKIERKFRQYPHQTFSDIANECLKQFLKNPTEKPSRL